MSTSTTPRIVFESSELSLPDEKAFRELVQKALRAGANALGAPVPTEILKNLGYFDLTVFGESATAWLTAVRFDSFGYFVEVGYQSKLDPNNEGDTVIAINLFPGDEDLDDEPQDFDDHQ